MPSTTTKGGVPSMLRLRSLLSEITQQAPIISPVGVTVGRKLTVIIAECPDAGDDTASNRLFPSAEALSFP